MRVGGDAGDIIDGDVGDDGRTIAVGKGNRQLDQANRLNVNFGGDYSRQEREQLSLGDRVRDLERTVYGDTRYGITGVLAECKLIRETVNDIQKAVHHDPHPASQVLLWVVGAIVSLASLVDLWNVLIH